MSNKEPNKKSFNSYGMYFLIFCVAIFLIVQISLLFFNKEKSDITYSDFLAFLEKDKVESVNIIDNSVIEGVLKNNDERVNFKTLIPYHDSNLMSKISSKNIKLSGQSERFSLIVFLLQNIPFVILIVLSYYIFKSFSKSSSKTFSFGKSKVKKYLPGENKISFEDVAGQHEAKEDLKEVVEFLKNPQKFKDIGAKIPKGVLLVGEPGTGKTLMARAIAGESDVGFFHISGSDFVEMFVGVGASRVRDLFEQGKRELPCIIFIDELDAVGKARNSGLGNGSNDEREQTLNQLLVEMDGFDASEGLVVVAATNRKDVLDPALLRPGRFDRHVYVTLPDFKEREDILKIHTKSIKIKKEGENKFDIEKIAKITTNFSGADLASLSNEAALLAARDGQKEVDMKNFESAYDKITIGNTRKSNFATMSEKIKLQTSYHECGHALISYLIDTENKVNKVTIIPRGRALGATSYIANEDALYGSTKEDILKNIKSLFGGYAAEQLVYNTTTSGVSNDLERATNLARVMVCKLGMSDLGPVNFSKDENYFGDSKNYSEKTASLIDEEVRKILDKCLKDVLNLLKENKDKLDIFAQELVLKETLSNEEIQLLLFENKTTDVDNKETLVNCE